MTKLYEKLLKAQSEFPSIKKDKKNPHFKSDYTSLDSLIAATMPVLHANKLVSYQTMSPSEDGRVVTVNTFVVDTEDGEDIESSLTLPMDKLTPQGAGAAITYARRYAYAAILGITSDEDDDGQQASHPPAPQRAPEPPKEVTTTAFGYRPKTWPEKAAFSSPVSQKVKDALDAKLGELGLGYEAVDVILEQFAMTAHEITSDNLMSMGCYLAAGSFLKNAPDHSMAMLRECLIESKGLTNPQ